jgi:diguanylate cyclase (GGDEF)-like protein/PAS domain S-box-containing protein
MKDAIPTALGEGARLAALRDLMVLDTSAEEVFDGIVRFAAEICGTPIALLSLVDEERQWFKASVGLHGVTQTPREMAFCAHAILGDEVFVVPDAAQDARFAENPLVTGAPDIRFYAGAPLVLEGGARLGTLCVIDQQVRKLDESQLRMLRSLAKVASDALVMRRDLIVKSISARSRYERALLDSESHYRAIVEDQAELISLALSDGELTYVNPSYAMHFGLAPGDVIGRSLYDFIAPADRVAVHEHLAQVARTGEAESSENRMIAADGSELWVAWTNGVQRDARGDVLIHSVGRDVTARVKAENALRASQSFLYRTGRVAGVGGWEVDLATRVVTWSDETRNVHEVGPEFQPTLESAVQFYAPAARAAIQEVIQTALDWGEPWDIELPLVTAKGRHIWVRAAGSVEYENDVAVRLVGAFQDVSERKRLEQRVVSQTATLTLVTDAIPATVAVIDLEGRYRFVNSAFEREQGLFRDDIVGRMASEVLGEEEFARRWPWAQRAMQGEAVVFELDYPGHDGPAHVSLNYVPLRLPTGELDGFAVVTQDVTRQRREAIRLTEASERDPLTGLLNRAGFKRYLDQALGDRGGPSLALLYIDLDRFKPVNDLHGHPVGDEVLRLFGKRLAKLVRPSDAVVRLGGDEFAVALANAHNDAAALGVADKVLAAAGEPFRIGDLLVHIGASIGIAYGLDDGERWTDLVARADARLLNAKASGKGRHAGGTR